jgi:hypothetical protein
VLREYFTARSSGAEETIGRLKPVAREKEKILLSGVGLFNTYESRLYRMDSASVALSCRVVADF